MLKAEESPAVVARAKKGRVLVLCALPYTNGIPHIGNLVGSHLPADIFAHGRVASVVGLNVMCNALAAIAVIQFTGHIVEHSSYTPAFVLVALLLPTASLCARWLVLPGKETA